MSNFERKIRVLQVPGSLRIGGLEKVSVNLFLYCDKQKYSFDYLVYGDEIEPLEDVVKKMGARVFHVPYPHVNIKKYLNSIRKIMIEQGPYDVVHSHSLFNSGLVLKVAAQERIPIRIAHAHSDRRTVKTGFFRIFYNKCMQLFINKYATKKIACSEGAGEYLYGKKHVERLKIMKNGVDIDKFQYNIELREKIRKEFNWENCKIVGHIGRLAPVKNQKKIIDIFLKAYELDSRLRLMIVGDGELYKELLEQIKTFGLEKVIALTGTRNDVPALLSSFDIYIMTSFYEGVSISLIEAQASGLHCIVSENAASKETRLTKNLKIIKLDESDDIWAKEIIKTLNEKRDLKASDIIKDEGYDVKESVLSVLKEYEN